MRGVFTCGVLDFFMDNRIRFPFTVGFRYLLTQGCIMDFKLLLEDFPERIIPYDYPAYAANPDRFAMVTTNCLTGQAEYFEEKIPASAGSPPQP